MKRLRHIDWAQAAVRVAEKFPLSRIHPKVLGWSRSRSRSALGPWLVALSGGGDSVALLLLLWAHWPEKRKKLVACHFDHRLRGAESRRDAEFCRRLAQALGVRFHSGIWQRKAPRRKVSEAQARNARMLYFEDTLSAIGSRALFLGHQMDDVAETLLMRVARGSGSSGLSAPRPVQEMGDGSVKLRPLLAISRRELRSVLKAAGVMWREDLSNGSDAYLRNRMRNVVLPKWAKACPERDAVAGAALSREQLQEDDEALDIWLMELNPFSRGPAMKLDKLRGKPIAIQRRALRQWINMTRYRGDLSRQGFESLLASVMKGSQTRHSLGAEGFAVIKNSTLRYAKNRRNLVTKK